MIIYCILTSRIYLNKSCAENKEDFYLLNGSIGIITETKEIVILKKSSHR